jgi:eukaryotic-like serine/threonine-protein kinase
MTDSALIGQTIAGRFRITGFIGEGAMATVYRGVQEARPHDVAVKIMHAHLARDPTFAGRFRREAKAASLLKHPNTVYIVDYGEDQEMLYIAMELIAGQDLFEMLVLERRFSEARAARIVAQVCDALTVAHARGIIHRDLKPENVMIVRDDAGVEHVKVLDFGIAKVLERDKRSMSPAGPSSDSEDNPVSLAASALTTVGVVVGTPAYMSPEQCRAEPVDARSDVYSCGILLYQLVCGRTPFTGDSPIEIAINQVRQPPDPPSSVVPGVHPGLEQIILTALEKWPAQRHQSAAEMRDALRAIQFELSEEKKPLADGRQPPAPEIMVEDRVPGSEEAADLAATLRQEEGFRPPSLKVPPAGTLQQIKNQLGSTLISPGGISQPPPSSDPMSGPSSIEVFPQPLGPPLAQRPPLPQAPLTPPAATRAITGNPFGGAAGRPITANPQVGALPPPAFGPAPGPPTRRPHSARQRGLPTWVVLLIAIVVGVGVGLAAHLIVGR